jgi:hypothetical protein
MSHKNILEFYSLGENLESQRVESLSSFVYSTSSMISKFVIGRNYEYLEFFSKENLENGCISFKLYLNHRLLSYLHFKIVKNRIVIHRPELVVGKNIIHFIFSTYSNPALSQVQYFEFWIGANEFNLANLTYFEKHQLL